MALGGYLTLCSIITSLCKKTLYTQSKKQKKFKPPGHKLKTQPAPAISVEQYTRRPLSGMGVCDTRSPRHENKFHNKKLFSSSTHGRVASTWEAAEPHILRWNSARLKARDQYTLGNIEICVCVWFLKSPQVPTPVCLLFQGFLWRRYNNRAGE